jgi:hypothetical protein
MGKDIICTTELHVMTYKYAMCPKEKRNEIDKHPK